MFLIIVALVYIIRKLKIDERIRNLEIQLDVDASMENNFMNKMFKESNDQNDKIQEEANTSSENKVINQLVIDIENSFKSSVSESTDRKSVV